MVFTSGFATLFSHTHYVSSLISRGEVTTKCNSEENHHFYFLKHIPIPHSLRAFFEKTDSEDGDDLKGERNQRAIGGFHFRWFQNSVIEIVEATEIPSILNHLK